MEYSVIIPDRIARQLERRSENVSQQFREALAVQKYRTRDFTAFQVGEMLGHASRWETDAFLKKHHCHGYTEEDFEKDAEQLLILNTILTYLRRLDKRIRILKGDKKINV